MVRTCCQATSRDLDHYNVFISGLLWLPVVRFSYKTEQATSGSEHSALCYAKLTSCRLQIHDNDRMNQFSHLDLDKIAKKKRLISQNEQSFVENSFFPPHKLNKC